MTNRELFLELFAAKDESEVEHVLNSAPEIFAAENWFPLGGNESNFSIIENQQSHPVAAVIEKLTNSIDAILMKECAIRQIDPKGPEAPTSLEDAVERFFPKHKNWDLSVARRTQALDIQIIGDGYPGGGNDTSLIVYDNGEGQRPGDFEGTFLSLVRGNKNEIAFVQGKYNMGGTGALIFCGTRRFQLIGSRHHEGGEFGFTLVRRHPYVESEKKKNTWYEYFKRERAIPSFSIEDLELGLHERRFKTGTVLKLYSYNVKGQRHVRRDLSRSLNEYLYQPALPILAVESATRFPNDRALETVIFGLKRRLESQGKYVETTFSQSFSNNEFGDVNIQVHVFKPRVEDKSVSESKKTIRDEFFKNNMSVLFSLNGQVHGHYTSEFISRKLKFNLLKDYLLIHVDCTKMRYEFRTELFMASRDRLKQGEEASLLRDQLGKILREGRLKDIYKARKDSIAFDLGEDEEVLKKLASDIPLSEDLRRLLSSTFKLDRKGPNTNNPAKEKISGGNNGRPVADKVIFKPSRYPTFFRIAGKHKGDVPVISVPLGGQRTVNFDTDVDDQFFDRTEDPGDLQIALLTYKPNSETGGDQKGTANHITEVMTIVKQSPTDGRIKLVLEPTKSVNVGDEIEVQVDLNSTSEDFTQIFRAKIAEPRKEGPTGKVDTVEDEPLGLPQLKRVFQACNNVSAAESTTVLTWENLEGQGIEFDHSTIMHPDISGDSLETIYINMDSGVLKSYKSKLRSSEQHQLADRRYLSAIYFHTLFLYTISRNRGYEIRRQHEDEEVDLTYYLKDMFSSHYAAFLLNFEVGELVEALA